MTNEQFLGQTISEMIAHGVTVQFNKRTYNSKHSYNFFDETKPRLHMNYFDENFDSWFPIYVHEYCHYLQWKSGEQKWDSYSSSIGKMNERLDGKNISVPMSDVRKVQELELDCDRRVLRIIKKYKLKIDVEEYIKQSNLYIYCHIYFAKYGKFFVPWENKECLDKMPTKLFSLKRIKKKIPGLGKLYEAELLKEFKLI